MSQPFPGILSFLSSQGGSITISPYIILGIAGVFAIVGAVLALLLNYHWKVYAVDKLEILRVRFWYFSGFIFLGAGMLITAVLFALSL